MFNKLIKIADKSVGPDRKPFIIAEMSGNHNQSLERAFEIIDAAASTNVDALKLQTYTADTMTIDSSSSDFRINDKNSLWSGESLYNLYQQAHTPWEWHKPIFDRCKSKGLICFSTPFDETAVDFLEDIGCPAYKIASFENTHLPLIAKIAKTGKPIIASTGMATLSDLQDMVNTVAASGNRDLVLLKCTSSYPATPAEANISMIAHMREMFNIQVGLSDHTMGIGVALAAIACGATVVEKHFTLRRADGGVDSAFSMEPAEMTQLVEEGLKVWQCMGRIDYNPTVSEQKSTQFRRSIYAVKDIKVGDSFTAENIKIIRPGFGLKPRYFDQVLASKARRDLKRGDPLTFADLS